MNAEEFKAIKARADAATPGPWEAGDVWLTAGLIWDADHNRVGPKVATHCGYCHHGEPVWAGRTDINGTVMRAHRHRDPDPYEPTHKISGADGASVAGNYDYEAGGILRPEDTEFIIHARTDVPALLAEVDRLRALTETCTCYDGSPANYEGPHADCPVCGAIRAFNETLVKLTEAEADRDRARDAAVALERENARVRALHVKRDVFEVDEHGVLGRWLSSGCEACSDPDLIADLEDGALTEDLIPWPCATIEAMDGGEAL